MSKPSIILVLALFGLAGCGTGPSLVCPQPQLHRGPGEITGAAANLKDIQARFKRSYSANDLNETIATLRRKFPDAGDDAIYNYLVAAYCPVAAQPGDSISVQRARLLTFENALRAVLGD